MTDIWNWSDDALEIELKIAYGPKSLAEDRLSEVHLLSVSHVMWPRCLQDRCRIVYRFCIFLFSGMLKRASSDADLSQCLIIAFVESIIVPSMSKSIEEYCRVSGGPEKSSWWLFLKTDERGRGVTGLSGVETGSSLSTSIVWDRSN
jgi:hypothetical protein